ncbi:hypothetical protein AAFC00_003031 [Neodothiora populina]|uniref:Laccase n=1 Tax=Neodothiora populina TaxID=2781224 RepID=A0ABR3P908_9PEZI
MALSLSNFLVAFLTLSCNTLLANAATVTYDWNITWVTANPSGQEERPVIGINGQWPLPMLNFTKGDRIIANVHNQLGNQSTSIHWHGFFQNGTNDMDGPQGVTQCGIAPNSTFTYDFTADQSGTYWYHSHTRSQYPDGLRQALIISDPEDPYVGKYDEELVITLSDWYNDQMPELMKQFISVANPTGAEPVPNAALMNDTQNFTLGVEPGKTYMLRLVNVGAFAGQYFWIEGHTMQVIEVDGVFTEAAEADMIYLTSAQRASVLVTTKNETDTNYAMVGSMDTDLFDSLPTTLNYNVTGWLVYDKAAPLPEPVVIDEFDPYDDFNLVPVDGEELYEQADYTITLDLTMDNLGDGANYAFFNDITYVSPKVPTLYSVLTTGSNATDAAIYGTDTNAFVLDKDEIVEIVLNNDDPGKHPFHLHGHNFQVITRSEDDAGHYDINNHSAFPAVPMRRDTLMVRPNGNFVVRFKADNPDKSMLDPLTNKACH